jgi:acyl carrier protein
VFDQPDLVITRDSNASTIDGWDSLTHLRLISAVEEQFTTEFTLDELMKLDDVGAFLDVVRQQLSAK